MNNPTDTTIQNNLPWIIYTRVSTDSQAREGVSMEAQEQKCRGLLSSRGVPEANIQLISDGGFSGKNFDRPGSKRLLELIKKRHIAGVCIYRTDRLTRSLQDLLYYTKLCDANDVKLVSICEHLDTQSAGGRLFLGMLGNFAQFERESISERVKMAMAMCRSRGAFIGGPVPAGMRVEGARGHRQLVLDPQWSPFIAELWKRCLDGASLSQLADWLNTKGVPSSHRRTWSRQTVFKLLRRRSYIGKLVDEATWQAVQHVLPQRRPSARPGFGERLPHRVGAGANRVYVLQGVAKCGLCGSPLLCTTGTGKLGKAYPYYRCSNKSRRGGCTAKELPAQEWERAALEALSHLTHASGPLARIWASELAKNAAKGELLVEERADLIRKRDGLREQLDRLVDAMAQGKAMADAVRARVERITAENQNHEILIAQLDGRLAAARMTEDDLETRMVAIRRGVECLVEQPPEKQREVITALVADMSLAAGEPLRVRIWPSPDVELQESEIKMTPAQGFVQASTVVGVQGFEPRQAESESAVLPLDDTPIGLVLRRWMMGERRKGQGSAGAAGFGAVMVPARICQ